MGRGELLPGFVIADLYTTSLVLIDADKSQKETTTTVINKPDKNYSGDYKDKIIVLVNDTANMYLDEKDLSFLYGILNACKLNIENIALINFSKNVLKFFDLKKKCSHSFYYCLV